MERGIVGVANQCENDWVKPSPHCGRNKIMELQGRNVKFHTSSRYKMQYHMTAYDTPFDSTIPLRGPYATLHSR